MKIIKRALQANILNALKFFPIVYINGPRQAGKTTLAKGLVAAEKFKANFITFDDALERSAAMRNPVNYLKESQSPLIIDEVQLVPEIFRPLKKLVDDHRQEVLYGVSKESANGHYLLTGSANLLATPALANAMVGRMATLTLLPLSAAEVLGNNSHFLQRCFSKDFVNIRKQELSVYLLPRL